ncbi:MAG: hypothetical protein L3J63_11295 [Geopsychrobacter sp.]|nr:hypothetical protein [Geopsychrobacter sp.]
MSQRLGELLVAEKLLSPHQLEEAIEAQCLYGGRLGTSLIELGFLSEEEIARTLSRKLHLPYIEPRLLMKIPSEVIDLVPQRLADKHQVIPCRLEKKRLYLAMADPTNLTIIDALAFRLGFIIVPVVVPEIRLMLAMQKYYHLELSLRIQTLSQKLSARKQQTVKTSTVTASRTKPPEESMTSQAEEKKEQILEVAQEDILDLDAQAEEKWPLLGEKESLDALSDKEYQDLINLPEHLRPSAAEPVAVEPAQAMETLRAKEQHPFQLFCRQLNAAENRDDIADAIIDYIAPLKGGVGLLMVKEGVAIGWKAAVDGEPLADFDQLQIPLAQPSVLRTVSESRSFYLGPLPKEVNNVLLSSQFSHTLPESVLLLPLMLRGRLVTLLYLQGIDEKAQQLIPEYQRVIDKSAMAFEMLILKNKIKMG